jgi:hypothetical protein
MAGALLADTANINPATAVAVRLVGVSTAAAVLTWSESVAFLLRKFIVVDEIIDATTPKNAVVQLVVAALAMLRTDVVATLEAVEVLPVVIHLKNA